MKKPRINTKEFNEWINKEFNMYASWTSPIKRKVLRMYVNHNGRFQVTFDGVIIYEGTQITHAITAWNSV